MKIIWIVFPSFIDFTTKQIFFKTLLSFFSNVFIKVSFITIPLLIYLLLTSLPNLNKFLCIF